MDVKINIMCDLLTTIYNKHQEYASDLSVGYPFSGKRNNQIRDMLHVYYLLSNSKLNDNEVLSILNYYDEY